MQRILAQCKKELRQFKRDRLTVALAFILPIITLFIFGFAIRLQAKNIPIYIQDFDQSPLSRQYIETLYASNQFQKISFLPIPFINNQLRTNDAEKILDQGIAKVAVIIPPEFSRKISRNSQTNVQIIIDGSDVNNARIIKNSIQGINTSFLNQLKSQKNTPKLIPKLRVWFNPGGKEFVYILPGVYGFVLWLFPSLLTALAVAKEKEQGTILQIYSSGISATEFLLGKLLTYIIIGIGQALLVMTIGALIWDLKLLIEPTSLIAGTLLFLVNSVSLGLMIGAKSDNQISAIQGIAPLIFITTFIFSGFIYSLSNIPLIFSPIPFFVPLRYYIDITRSIFIKGLGWSNIWLSIVILIILGILIFNMAKKKLNTMQLPES